MWNGQRNNLYRTTRNPITRSIQPADPFHAQFGLSTDAQGTDLALFQEFKSEQDPNGTEYWYHYDGEGNIAATTKHKAQSDHTYRYDEYGLILPDNGTSLGQIGSDNTNGGSGWDFPHNQYTLTQKYADPHTNLTYFGSRHYDPEMGVWLTQDVYRGTTPNPQSLHRYMYNNGSPVNYMDVYGFCYKQENKDLGCPDWMPDWTFDGIEWAVNQTADPVYAPANENQAGNIQGLYKDRMTVGEKATLGIAGGVSILTGAAVAPGAVAFASGVGTSVGGVALYWGAGTTTAGVVSTVTTVGVGTGIVAGGGAFTGGLTCMMSPASGRQLRQSCETVALAGGVLYTTSYGVGEAIKIISQTCNNLPTLEISKSKMPNIARNIESAQRSGQPVILTRTTDPTVISSNRAAATKGYSTISPDEYPFASTLEGGSHAQVQIVPLKEQQIQGGVISNFYNSHKIQQGDQFIVKVVD